MKIATWNVNGIRARLDQVVAFLANEQPDVLCLQELKAAPDQIPASLRDTGDYWCAWHGTKGYSGVALLVRRSTVPQLPVFEHPTFDFEHRAVYASVSGVTVASLYVPNGGKDFAAKMRFLEAIDHWVAEHAAAGGSLVLCGDFNVTRADIDVHPNERKATAIGQLPEERALFAQLLSRGLTDINRQLDPENDVLFTWWAPWRKLRERNIGWRIDYILASERLAVGATSCRAEREVGTSDHGPVIATIDLPV